MHLPDTTIWAKIERVMIIDSSLISSVARKNVL